MTETAPLPAIISSYLTAHRDDDADTALTVFTDDATVIDEGHTYRGLGEIDNWLHRSASEYTYTIELTRAAKLDDDHYDLTHHLEGNFPGGQVDLHFRFTLRDGSIARLVIET